MTLVEINPLDVQRVFPSFYHENSQFFMIAYETCEVGIYGIKTIDPKVCEISLCIFDEYRFKLPYRTGLKLLLNFPFNYKFDKILISTQENQSLLCYGNVTHLEWSLSAMTRTTLKKFGLRKKGDEYG